MSGTRLTGTLGANTLTGGDRSELIYGAGGADLLLGGGGNDVFLFDGQPDFTVPGRQLAGGAGFDALRFRSAVSLSDAAFQGITGLEAIQLSATGLTSLTLGAAASLAFADGVTVTAAGLGRLDLDGGGLAPGLRVTANGAGGADTLRGGTAGDMLAGGGGDDLLVGGLGADVLTGGLGNDRFIHAADRDAAAPDTVVGGLGFDTLEIVLDDALLGRTGLLAELTRLHASMASIPAGTEGRRFTSELLQLDMRGVEAVRVAHGERSWSLAEALAAPRTRSDNYTTIEDTSLAVSAPQGLLANDSGVGLTVVPAILTTFAVTTLRADGSFDYQPPADGSGFLMLPYTARDVFGRSVDGDFWVYATPVNDAPRFSGPTELSLSEGGAASRRVAVVGLHDPDNTPNQAGFFYRMTGGEGVFTWEAGNGVLFAQGLDFEARRSWTLVFEAGDGEFIARHTLDVTVTDLDEPPVIDILAPLGAPENTRDFVTIGSVFVRDPEGMPASGMTARLIGGDGHFDWDPATGILRARGLDREATAVWNLVFEASDGVNTVRREVLVPVANVNEPPVIVGPTALTVAENVAPDMALATILVQDPDGPVTAPGSYARLVGGDGVFSWAGGTAPLLANGLDYETRRSWTLVFEAGDDEFTVRHTLEVTVADVDEAPAITMPEPLRAPEGSTEFVRAGFVIIADPEGLPLTGEGRYARMLGGGDSFDWNPATGELRARNLDYDARQSWTLTFEASDGSFPVSRSVVVEVVDVNVPPVFTAPARVGVAEGSADFVKIADVLVADPDGTLVASADRLRLLGGEDRFEWRATGELFARSLDFETRPSWTLTFEAADGPNTARHTLVVDVTDVNEPPGLSGPGEIRLAEGRWIAKVLGIFEATDPDAGAELRFSLAEGFGLFSIGARDGVLLLNGALDFETRRAYELEVRVTDGAFSVARPVTLFVEDADDTPLFLPSSLSAATMREDVPIGTRIGELRAFDADAGALVRYEPLTWASPSGLPVPFSVDAETGEIKVSGRLDHDTVGTYVLTARARGDSETLGTAELRFATINVNEPPVPRAPLVTALAEGTQLGMVLGFVSATDPDAGTVLTYAIDARRFPGFSVTAEGAVLFSGTLDYEATPVIVVPVLIGDGEFVVESPVTVAVIDMNEPAVLAPGASTLLQVPETAPLGSVIGRIPLVDPDAGATLRFGLAGPNPLFVVDGATGDIILTGLLNHGTAPSLSLPVFGVDNGSLVTSLMLTVEVQDAPEPLNGPRGVTLLENQAPSSTPLAYFFSSGTALDPSRTVFSLLGGGSSFRIDPASGALFQTAPLDHETMPFLDLTIRAQDGTSTVDQHFGVVVQDVDEPIRLVGAPTGTVVLPENLSVDWFFSARADIARFRLVDPDDDVGAGNLSVRVNGRLDQTVLQITSNGNVRSEVSPFVTSVIGVDISLIPMLGRQFDAERDGPFLVELLSSRGEGVIGAFTLVIGDVNEFAPILNGPTALAVTSRASFGTVLAVMEATDGDIAADLRFSLADGFGRFEIDELAGTIVVAGPLGAPATYDLRVRISDGRFTDEQDLRITVVAPPAASADPVWG
jgi:hypothetical protein